MIKKLPLLPINKWDWPLTLSRDVNEVQSKRTKDQSEGIIFLGPRDLFFCGQWNDLSSQRDEKASPEGYVVSRISGRQTKERAGNGKEIKCLEITSRNLIRCIVCAARLSPRILPRETYLVSSRISRSTPTFPESFSADKWHDGEGKLTPTFPREFLSRLRPALNSPSNLELQGTPLEILRNGLPGSESSETSGKPRIKLISLHRG